MTKKKVVKIILNVVPIALMLLLIPLVKNDYVLTLLYTFIIITSLVVRYEKKDLLFLTFGFFIMILSEYFFISAGVETFVRKSLFGVMPLWLPFLWAYAFIAIKRAITILL